MMILTPGSVESFYEEMEKISASVSPAAGIVGALIGVAGARLAQRPAIRQERLRAVFDKTTPGEVSRAKKIRAAQTVASGVLAGAAASLAVPAASKKLKDAAKSYIDNTVVPAATKFVQESALPTAERYARETVEPGLRRAVKGGVEEAVPVLSRGVSKGIREELEAGSPAIGKGLREGLAIGDILERGRGMVERARGVKERVRGIIRRE